MSTPMSLRRRSSGLRDPELTLLPFMNLMTLLIPFLLMSAQFVSLAVIDSSAPSITPRIGTPTDEPLHLTVGITESAFVLSGNSDALKATPAIERLPDGSRDYAALTDALAAVKVAHPTEENIILAPDGDVPYEVVVGVMDAARWTDERADLFPFVVFAGGAKTDR